MIKSVNSVDRHVGSRVKLQRQRLGIGDEIAAGVLGMTAQQYEERERGVFRFDAKDLQKLTRLLDVSAAFFFEGVIIQPRSTFPRAPKQAVDNIVLARAAE